MHPRYTGAPPFGTRFCGCRNIDLSIFNAILQEVASLGERAFDMRSALTGAGVLDLRGGYDDQEPGSQ
jgi:hypothetical protein